MRKVVHLPFLSLAAKLTVPGMEQLSSQLSWVSGT